MPILEDTNLLNVTYTKSKDVNEGKFTLEPFSPGYGLTIGHALRRVLLSSLSGAAISSVKIEGANHEFSTIIGVKEDVIEIILNLKNIRFKMHGDEPVTLTLSKKGTGEVKAKDFAKNSQIEIINPEEHIATLDKNAKFNLEAVIKKGRGYEPVERRKDEKLPIGTIAVDSIFTPVKKIHYDVENTRVGGMTNYDKVTIEITTDGTISPEDAMKTANQILVEHFSLISGKLSAKEKKTAPKKEPVAEKPADKKPAAKPKKTKSAAVSKKAKK